MRIRNTAASQLPFAHLRAFAPLFQCNAASPGHPPCAFAKPLLRSYLLLIYGLSPYGLTLILRFESKLSPLCLSVMPHGSML